MQWIYLSPHLDDVVLSVGGMVWEQTWAGEQVEVWTICAGDPPPAPYTPFAEELHARWGTSGGEAARLRRSEDQAACGILGAQVHHCQVPDCIYRRLPGSNEPVIKERDELFSPHPPDESELIAHIAQKIQTALPEDVHLVSPMALGGHIDHRLVRSAADSLDMPVWYYADYPYAVEDPITGIDLRGQTSGYQPVFQQGISTQALTVWQQAVAAYSSQISTFWGSLDEMRARIAAYHQEGGGAVLWQARREA